MLSESDLDSFQNGRTDSPRSTSSTSSPLHHQKTTPSALGRATQHYKSVITTNHLQASPPDFISPKQQQQSAIHLQTSPDFISPKQQQQSAIHLQASPPDFISSKQQQQSTIHLQTSPDFISPKFQQQRTYASCSPPTDTAAYNDSCYFEATTRQHSHLVVDSSIKYALSKCDTYADCLSSSNGANDYGCPGDPGGVQPQYTSVIVDAQQYQMSNGFVH